MTKKQKKLLIRIIISLVLFAAVFTLEKLSDINGIILLLLYLIPYLTAGYDILLGFGKKLIRGKLFDEEFLMTIATVGALIIGEYPESVFVMVFYQTGELFQSIAVGKSRKSISALMDICPDTAVVIREGEEITVSPDEVSVGETVLVRPGEKIPLDGKVSEGESTVNTAALTGESAPYEVYSGSEVKAGSINLTGTVKITVLKEYGESTAAKILELVENSSLNKAKSEKFLTRFARFYTPAVVISALLLAVIPSLITGDVKEWVYRALIFLVVSCPCALVISVPLSFFGGIGGASSKGILIKGANYLEALAKADTFIFDKTGTLTTGEFSVTEISPIGGVSEEELLSMGASAEYRSNHPIAKSIVSAVPFPIIPDSTKEFPGGGIQAVINGERITAGNLRFFNKNNISVPDNISDGTVVLIAKNGIYQGFIRLSDTPKKNIKEALRGLRRAGVSRIVMLTGDNETAATETAEKLGISEFRYSLLPEDKAEITGKICKEKKKNSTVVFVGDGINDAPVLSSADVGIAMGGIGSDAAIEAADIVIMDDSIEKCVKGIEIAKKTRRIVRQNVAFALGVKFAVLILASFGFANMWIGVLADVGVAVIAILNAVRTLRSK